MPTTPHADREEAERIINDVTATASEDFDFRVSDKEKLVAGIAKALSEARSRERAKCEDIADSYKCSEDCGKNIARKIAAIPAE